MPDAFSRLPGSQERGPDIYVAFPDDATEADPGGEATPQAPNLDGVLLKELEAEYSEEPADVMTLAPKKIRALLPP